MTDAIIVIVVAILLYPFVVLLTAKLAAYGWLRGKQEFSKQENTDGDTTTKEETGAGLGQEKN